MDKSWEWILGYTTAIQNIASFNNSEKASQVDWLSAIGSIGAAFFAAVAAIISLLSIRASNEISIKNYKNVLHGEVASLVSLASAAITKNVKVQTSFNVPKKTDKNYEDFTELKKRYTENLDLVNEKVKETKELFLLTFSISNNKDIDYIYKKISVMKVDIFNYEMILTTLIVEAKTAGFLDRNFHL